MVVAGGDGALGGLVGGAAGDVGAVEHQAGRLVSGGGPYEVSSEEWVTGALGCGGTVTSYRVITELRWSE